MLTELTAYRSLALRQALASDPAIAYLAMLHALTLRLFYRYTNNTSLQIEEKDDLVSPFEGLAEAPTAQFIDENHRAWEAALPEEPEKLWDALLALDDNQRRTLFAHCVALTLNAVHQAHGFGKARMRHADQLAVAAGLDMSRSGWETRADNFFSRLTKTQIITAVTEAKGAETAMRLSNLKKKDMALEAERLLRDTDWLPEPLRTPLATVSANGEE